MVAEHALPAELGQQRGMSVEDASAESSQRGRAHTLQIPREKDDINLIRSKRRANGSVEDVLRRVGGRGEMVRRTPRSSCSGQRPGSPVVADDHNHLTLNQSGCTGIENALKCGAFMRGQNPDLQHCWLSMASAIR